MNTLIFIVSAIQILFIIAIIIAAPFIIALKIKERRKEKQEEDKKDYSDY